MNRFFCKNIKNPIFILLTIVSFNTYSQSDLIPTSFYVLRKPIIIGTSANFGGGVKNISSDSADYGALCFYLSKDTVLDANDELLLEGDACGSGGRKLGEGDEQPITVSGYVTEHTQPGTYYIIAYADPLNELEETNESNNYSFIPVELISKNSDLSVFGFSAPEKAKTHSMLYFNCSIKNSGNYSSGNFKTITFLSNDKTFDSSDIPLDTVSTYKIGVGDFRTVNFRWAIPDNILPGTYYIIYCADVEGTQSDPNRENNFGVKEITIQRENIDLVLDTIFVSPVVDLDNDVFLEMILDNQGSKIVTSEVRYYLSKNKVLDKEDVQVSSTSIDVNPDFPYRFRVNLVFPFGTKNGEYYLIGVADPDDLLTEVNEENNTLISTLTIGDINPIGYNEHKSLSACSGFISDHAGSGNYYNEVSGSVTVSSEEEGKVTELDFLNYWVKLAEGDTLCIFDGEEVGKNLIGCFNETNPGVIKAKSPSGALTLDFRSDGFAYEQGFLAKINCVAPSHDMAFEEVSFDVFPNPAKDFLEISLKQDGSGSKVTLVNSLGIIVIRYIINQGKELKIKTQNLPKGSYLLSIENKEGVSTKRIYVK